MLGGVFACDKLTAGKADPRSIAVLGGLDEGVAVGELLLILEVSFLVAAFDRGDALKSAGDLVKAFFPCFLCKSRVHLSPLVVFAACCFF